MLQQSWNLCSVLAHCATVSGRNKSCFPTLPLNSIHEICLHLTFSCIPHKAHYPSANSQRALCWWSSKQLPVHLDSKSEIAVGQGRINGSWMTHLTVIHFILYKNRGASQRCQQILKWLQISWKCTFAYTFVQKHLSKISWNQEISWRLASLQKRKKRFWSGVALGCLLGSRTPQIHLGPLF